MSPSASHRATDRPAVVDAIGVLLAHLVASARALTIEAAHRFDPELPPAAFPIARWLLAFGPSRTNDIANGVAMDRSAVSRLIDQLRSAHLVSIAAHPTDGRANSVRLTPAGRRHVTRALHWKGGVFHDRLATWNERDLETLARLLTKLNEP